MPQSIFQSYQHLVFSTKKWNPLIKKENKEALQKYISGILNNLDSPVLSINAMPDHIHILFRQSKHKSAVELINSLKTSSSIMMKSELFEQQFAWQTGYACFSVSPNSVESVKKYIENQEEHHEKLTFRQEVEQFMKEYGIDDYNHEYFWSE